MAEPTSDALACIEAGKQIANATEKTISINGIPGAIIKGQNGSEQFQLLTAALEAADARADRPRRLLGTSTHTEIDSFIAHVNRFKQGDSAIFADTNGVELTAVIDYHTPKSKPEGDGEATPKAPSWCEHRSVYTCPLSDQWKIWTGQSGREFKQDDFAQFIEDNMADLANPAEGETEFPKPADVLLMARHLVVRSKGEFSRSVHPTTGEASLVCKNEHETESTKIPRAFLLQLPVFEGGEMYRVEARIRFRLSGAAFFSFLLYQPDVIKRHAFGEVREKVKKETALPVFAGSPEE